MKSTRENVGASSARPFFEGITKKGEKLN